MPWAGRLRTHTSVSTLRRAIHNVNLAHGAAVDALRVLVPRASIGAIHNVQPCLPSTPADADAADLLGAYWNAAFPDPQCLGHYPSRLVEVMEPYVRPGDLARICRPLDWFGLNHYSPIYAAANPNSPLGVALGAGPADVSQTPIGWPIVPEALCETLHQVHNRYRLPIYVTENGLGAHDAPDADGKIDDTSRIEFLSAYIAAVRRAISESVDVRGYFVWSLLDNFEWASGYAVRFGLVHVAYPTQKRTAKASFFWYADLIKAASRVIEPAPSGLGGFNLLR